MKLWKKIRWVVLVLTVLPVLLLLKRPAPIMAEPPAPATIAENAKSFDSKVNELQQAHERGEAGTEVRLTSDEISAAFAASNPAPQVTPAAAPASDNPLTAATDLKPEQVPVKDTQVLFAGDEVHAQFTADVHGKDMVVTLSAKLGARDGYVTFEPTSFMVGSMPVPISLIQPAVEKKLSDPATREQLKLPAFISDLRIENGELVLVEK